MSRFRFFLAFLCVSFAPLRLCAFASLRLCGEIV
jgi:hypothetical protein